MTERRETDPTRIAQLLASEVTGRSRGPLGRLAVVDAEPEATPSADGSLAYQISLEESGPDEGTDRGEDSESGGSEASRVIGAVHLYQEAAVVSLPPAGRNSGAVDLPDRALAAGDRATPGDRDDGAVARDGGRLTVEVQTGAAVKPAVDVLAAVADSAGTDPGRDDVPSGRE